MQYSDKFVVPQVENVSEYLKLFSLSRTFCHLFFRKDAEIDHIPELEQISAITGVDIQPIYQMETYQEEEELGYWLGLAEGMDESERQAIFLAAEKNRKELDGNIQLIQKTVGNLITALSCISDIPNRLAPTEVDVLDNSTYFSKFNTDTGDGYLDNNFGQDLRNFKRFLDSAIDAGATIVWFGFG